MLSLADARRREPEDRCHLCGLPKAVCRDGSLEKQIKVEFERCFVTTAASRLRAELSKATAGVAAVEHVEALDFLPMVPNPLAGLLGADSPA